MNIEQAAKIIGYNTSKIPLRNMVNALGFHSWNNTQEENERREAGKVVLRNWSLYLELRNNERNKNMSKQEFENKYSISKEVEAFYKSNVKQTSGEQISIQFSSLSEGAQVKVVLELTANESARRRNG